MILKVFILAGQSNMQGCGNFGVHPRLYDDRLFCFKDNAWLVAREPLHEYTCKVWPDGGAGLAMSFAIRLLENFPEWEIGLVPCAVSGSSLEQWQPGAELFENAVSRTRQALTACDGELAGILWHQGEADSKSAKTAETYAERFQKTLGGLRTAFANEHLPVIAGELGRFLSGNPDFPYYAKVNKALRHTATSFVSSGGLTDNDRNDNTHFDALSLREFGLRYADVYMKFTGNK